MSDKSIRLNSVIECTIATLTIKNGYKLIVNDNSNVGIMVRIFQSAMLNKENRIVGIKVTREEDPNKIIIVQARDIKTVIHKDRQKTWERVDGGNFVSQMAIATILSFKRTTMNSNCNNEVDGVGEEDSSVEVIGTYHNNKNVDKSYQEVIKENKKREQKKCKKN